MAKGIVFKVSCFRKFQLLAGKILTNRVPKNPDGTTDLEAWDSMIHRVKDKQAAAELWDRLVRAEIRDGFTIRKASFRKAKAELPVKKGA